MKKNNFDVLIIGSGLAGLATALKLADDKSIGIVCKTQLTESSSHWAQGGVAAAISPKILFHHILRTLRMLVLDCVMKPSRSSLLIKVKKLSTG